MFPHWGRLHAKLHAKLDSMRTIPMGQIFIIHCYRNLTIVVKIICHTGAGKFLPIHYVVKFWTLPGGYLIDIRINISFTKKNLSSIFINQDKWMQLSQFFKI
ncbi:MAG: hypothetical protein LBC30_00475 [Puniceicoccales bacterium]|jgi:hypothetical protein|nr:hypothetical protein [Puniceicoccales bacterium]